MRSKKRLSMAMVQRLRARFRVPADLLLPPPKKSPPWSHFRLPFARWMLEFIRSRSFQFGQQLPRFTDQSLNLPALFDRLLGEAPVLCGILIAPRSARSGRAAMHPTALLAADRRGKTRPPRAGFCSAARAGQHGTGISPVLLASHAFRSAHAKSARASVG